MLEEKNEFSIWVETNPSDDLLQGDLLVECKKISNLGDESLIVITADCDIHKGKYGKYISCLRVISMTKYMHEIWGEKKYTQQVNEFYEALHKLVNKWIEKQGGEMSRNAAIFLVKNNSDEVAIELLGVNEDAKERELVKIRKFKSILDCLESASSDGKSYLERFVGLKKIYESAYSIAGAKKQAENEVFSNTPIDLFVIPSRFFCNDVPAVVLLREIIPISQCDIIYRISEKSEEKKYLRVARAESTYKHAISQAFGYLYSRIGFSESFEKSLETSKSNFKNKAWK
ncbi:MAG: hypothetical protein K2Q15_08360 [Burkholderiales bacterium]|nr:hypothetical protein [Burkholderiales bacterium]